MKEYFQKIFSILFMLTILYILAFVASLSWNPIDWNGGGRVILVAVVVIGGIIILLQDEA